MGAPNQISFKLTDPVILDQFKAEAAKRNISIHEYSRSMAIQGHLSFDSQSLLSTAALKTVVTSLTTLRQLAKELMKDDAKAEQVLAAARNDAQAILQSLGVEL